MADSPADQLTAAARKIRESVTTLPDTARDATWVSRPENTSFAWVIGDSGWAEHIVSSGSYRSVADHIALMGNPSTALAVAHWLDGAAKSYNASVVAAERVWGPGASAVRDEWVIERTDQNALAVARALLGEVTE